MSILTTQEEALSLVHPSLPAAPPPLCCYLGVHLPGCTAITLVSRGPHTAPRFQVGGDVHGAGGGGVANLLSAPELQPSRDHTRPSNISMRVGALGTGALDWCLP